MIPYDVEKLLAQLGPHERLPLVFEGLEGKPQGWVRARLQRPISRVAEDLRDAGCSVTPARHDDRAFLLVRTPEGDRLELEPGPLDSVHAINAFTEGLDRAIQARRVGSSVLCWQGSVDAIKALLSLAIDPSWSSVLPDAILETARARLPTSLREHLRQLRVSLNLRETLADLRTVLDFAQALSRWLPAETGVKLGGAVEQLRTTLEGDRFWNLRDVSRWWGPHVRAGVLWRGRPPATYEPEGFWEHAKQAHLERYIDLRGPTERLKNAYPPNVVGCTSCPVGGDPRAGSGDLESLYRRMPIKAAPAVGATLAAIAASEGPVLVHCAAGVDRTGVVVAMIGAWLGVPRERLVADYLASGQLVEARRLIGALDFADEQGIDELIAMSSIAPGTAEAARRRLLP